MRLKQMDISETKKTFDYCITGSFLSFRSAFSLYNSLAQPPLVGFTVFIIEI